MGGAQVERVDEVKLVGFIFDKTRQLTRQPAPNERKPRKTKTHENYSNKLNNELNAHTDWNAIRKDLN